MTRNGAIVPQKQKSRRIARAIVLAAALGFAAPLVGLGGVQAAQAVPTCTNAGTDGSYATASCTGFGEARINVTCNAVAPFPRWTDYGTWTSINGGRNIVNGHEYCAASITVSVQRR